jgi:hypothetical protein
MSVIGIWACCSARRMGAVDENMPLDSIMMISPPPSPPPDSAVARSAPSAGVAVSQTLQTKNHTGRCGTLADTKYHVGSRCSGIAHVVQRNQHNAVKFAWQHASTEVYVITPAHLMQMLGRLFRSRGASSVGLRSATVAKVANV